jgi:hypothetical protein
MSPPMITLARGGSGGDGLSHEEVCVLCKCKILLSLVNAVSIPQSKLFQVRF